MTIRQFEVWVADLNPRLGTEAGKVRPVAVVQSDLLNRSHPSTLICPLTTQVSPNAQVLRIHLKKGECGLNQDSDLMVDQVRAIDNKRLLRKLGRLSSQAISDLKRSLEIVLDL